MQDTFVFPDDTMLVGSVLARNILADAVYQELKVRGGLLCAELHLTSFPLLHESAKVTRFYSDDQRFADFLNGVAIACDDGFLLDSYVQIGEVMCHMMRTLTASSIGRVMMSIVTPCGLIEMKAVYRDNISLNLSTSNKAATKVTVRAEAAHKWFKDHGYEC